MADQTVYCQYVSSTEEGRGHTESEVVHDNGVVMCEAEADVVLRKVGLQSIGGRTRYPVCRPHAKYLRTGEDVEIEWEQISEDPSHLASTGERHE